MAAKKKTEAADGTESESYLELLALVPELTGFGGRLAEQLKEKLGEGYTQPQVAALTGLSQPTISNLLTKPKRVRVQLATALKVAKGVGISLDVLLLDRQDPWKLLKKIAQQKGLQLDEQPPGPMPLGEPKPRQRRSKRS